MAQISRRIVLETLAELSSIGQRSDALRCGLIHPFPARMPLQVAAFILGRLTSPEEVVLDPMAGSGTTLVAAQALGRKSLGFDMDPLSVRIAHVSTLGKAPESFQRAAKAVLERAKELATSAAKSVVSEMSDEDRHFVDYWFPVRSQKELTAISVAIREQADHELQDLLWVVFSGLIVAKSAGASYALDLARSRPHRDLEKTVLSPFETWERRVKRVSTALEAWQDFPSGPRSTIRCGDARRLPLENGSVDFVLTSPPYLHAIDYIRAHKFALVWMGSKLDDLRAIRSKMIGSERGLFSRNGLPTAVEEQISDASRSTEARTRRYLSDIHSMLLELGRVVKPGGYVILVTGNAIISGRRRDSHELVRALVKDSRLEFVGSSVRKLRDDLRSLPPPRMAVGTNALGKRMRSETFVALKREE